MATTRRRRTRVAVAPSRTRVATRDRSRARATARSTCAHWPRCAGCVDVDAPLRPEAEARARAYFASLDARAGETGETRETHETYRGRATRWRVKAKLAARAHEGETRLGLFARGSHALEPIDDASGVRGVGDRGRKSDGAGARGVRVDGCERVRRNDGERGAAVRANRGADENGGDSGTRRRTKTRERRFRWCGTRGR